MFQVDDACFAHVEACSRRNLSAGSRLEVRLHPDGPMTAHDGGHQLTIESAGKLTRNAPIIGAKDLNISTACP